jgi:hypothetical protein
MPELITMSTREIDRLDVVQRVLERRLTRAKAGELIGLSERQVQRLCSSFAAFGPAGLVSKKRGRPSNRRLPLAQEKLLELHDLRVGRETLRKWMAAAVRAPAGGEARRLVRAALTDDARYGLVEYLSATGAEIVVTDALARADPVVRRAARASLVVWVAPDALMAAITRAAAISAPARVAAVLARLPAVPLLRVQLHRLCIATGPRQVRLL